MQKIWLICSKFQKTDKLKGSITPKFVLKYSCNYSVCCVNYYKKGVIMIKIGDIMFVQTKGICELINIAKNAFVGCDKNKEYYILKPVGASNNMMVYIPTASNVQMRKLSSKKACEDALKNIKSYKIAEKTDTETELSVFENSAKSCEFQKWVELLNTLLLKKSKTNKKQFNYQEQKLLSLMLSCVSEEIAYVLNKEKEEIKQELQNIYA